ncbi:hypothetical protein SNE510_27700 [Streptomyces sp. NE5-10]|nr:hypothetical protein SNE510_27700 [Streptomyces sp. NE5-10]
MGGADGPRRRGPGPWGPGARSAATTPGRRAARSLFVRFRTGELTQIFLCLARARFRDGRGSPADFRAAMTEAGELPAGRDGPARAEVTAGLERCRAEAAAPEGGRGPASPGADAAGPSPGR